MQFHFGADVSQKNGDRLGELRALLYDPDTQEVTAFVVQHAGLDSYDVLVPYEAVADTDDETVYLELSQDQFDDLDEYSYTRNVAPPPYNAEGDQDEVQEPIDVPDVPPVGAATGIESIAFTPIEQETDLVPPDDEPIDGTTTVYATDGELGHVRDVFVDGETRRMTSMVVERGLVFTHDSDVPNNWISSVQPGTIVLSVDSATVKAAQRA